MVQHDRRLRKGPREIDSGSRWLPGYLEIQRHMSIRTTGFVAAIPYACGVVGSIGAGWVTDRLMAGGFSPINSRKLPIIIGLVAMAVFTFVAAETPSNVVAVMAISAAVFFAGGASGMSWALASVAAPAHCTASVGSIQNFGGYLGDNIFVERLWWTVKHEWVYLRPAANGIEQKRSLGEFFDWYNLRRPHQALGWRTPDEAYLGQSTAATALAA